MSDLTHDSTGRELTPRELDILHGRTDLPESKRQDYLRLWAGKGTTSHTPSLPCPHLGAPTGGTVGCRTCSLKVLEVLVCELHGECVANDTPTSNTIKSCKYCDDNPENKKRAEKARAAVVTLLEIPEPPAPDLTPTRSRAVVTVAVGEEGKALLAASGPHMRRYAELHDADFVVLDWPGVDSWPMSAKFQVARVLDHYSRIAYVDADVLLRPGCVDLFSLCPPNVMGVCDELPYHQKNPGFGLEQSYRDFRRAMGMAPIPHFPHYFNAGVMVVPKTHQSVLLPPPRLHVAPSGVGRHCAEQHWVNARLHDSGLPYRLLDRRSNWQSWTGFEAAPPDAVLHWSGAGTERGGRSERIREAAAKSPIPESPTSFPLSLWEPVFSPFRGRRVKLLAMPNGNVGDELLMVAARKLLIHFGAEDADDDPEHLLVAPGGNMGGILNPEARRVREDALASGLPVTVLPQSWFGKEELSYAKCWAREPESLRYEPRASLTHDLSLCLTPEDVGVDVPESGTGAGVWLRSDGEGLFGGDDPAKVASTPADYFRLAASHAEILTDRLHFCIAGLLCNRTVTLLPGLYHKNRSVWEHSLRGLGCRWAPHLPASSARRP